MYVEVGIDENSDFLNRSWMYNSPTSCYTVVDDISVDEMSVDEVS